MIVSINPTYFCNFRCDFCYLTPEQLGNQKKISPERLDELLGQIPNIEHVDLYGGEVGAIKKSYFYSIKNVIRQHFYNTININTNYSMMHPGFFDSDVYLSVSYDFEAREKSVEDPLVVEYKANSCTNSSYGKSAKERRYGND